MLVLGIETSTAVSSVALWRDGVLARAEHRGRHHVEFLTPAVADLLAQANVTRADVTGLAVGLGPGLFTGMRAGIATGKALAHALAVPIVGVCSLDVLAFPLRSFAGVVWACADAKRGEVFAAAYREGTRVSEPRAVGPGVLADEIRASAGPAVVVGDGPEAAPEAFAGLERAGDRSPRADTLCELAVPALRAGGSSLVHLEPLYVRRSDAEIKWEERGVTIERPLRVKPAKRVTEQAARDRR